MKILKLDKICIKRQKNQSTNLKPHQLKNDRTISDVILRIGGRCGRLLLRRWKDVNRCWRWLLESFDQNFFDERR